MPTNIEWTRNPDGSKGETWPVVTGCTPVSEGCRNCYAARMAATRLKHHPRYEGLATIEDGRARWTGEVRLNYDVLEQPLHWKKPRRVFVASMGDLFHKNVSPWFACAIWRVMRECPQHTFQILTKRPRRMLRLIKTYIADHEFGIEPLPNVWVGISVENQAAADERIPLLLQTPAAVRFVSVEPMLSSMNLKPYIPPFGPNKLFFEQAGRFWNDDKEPQYLDWVICGAESGPGARPMHPDWTRSLRDQCQAAGIPFFFKSWGAWLHESQFTTNEQRNKGLSSKRCDAGDGYQFVRIGKKAAGHLLDGRAWQEFPKGACGNDTVTKT